MRFAARSDVGLVRKVNQDGYMTVQKEADIVIASVADGMGGHVAGEVASAIALQSLEQTVLQGKLDDQEQLLMDAIALANKQIYENSIQNPAYSGMGTTIVACIASHERVVIAHVGDSRAYLYSASSGISQLTEDHSLVNELVKRGQILPSEATHHPQRHMLTKALGTMEYVSPECLVHTWQAGDILLLCSDGLSGYVDDARIEFVLSTDASLQAKVDTLVDDALHQGGNDNITVVAVTMDDETVRRNQP